mgnify:CR=1 FL=1
MFFSIARGSSPLKRFVGKSLCPFAHAHLLRTKRGSGAGYRKVPVRRLHVVQRWLPLKCRQSNKRSQRFRRRWRRRGLSWP